MAKTSLSSKQRNVMKVLNAGGIIVVMRRGRRKYRFLDAKRNPLRFLHGRTFNALVEKKLITKQSNGCVASIAAN